MSKFPVLSLIYIDASVWDFYLCIQLHHLKLRWLLWGGVDGGWGKESVDGWERFDLLKLRKVQGHLHLLLCKSTLFVEAHVLFTAIQNDFVAPGVSCNRLQRVDDHFAKLQFPISLSHHNVLNMTHQSSSVNEFALNKSTWDDWIVGCSWNRTQFQLLRSFFLSNLPAPAHSTYHTLTGDSQIFLKVNKVCLNSMCVV